MLGIAVILAWVDCFPISTDCNRGNPVGTIRKDGAKIGAR